MNMKKYASLALAVLMVVALAACGAPAAPSSAPPAPGSQSAAPASSDDGGEPESTGGNKVLNVIGSGVTDVIQSIWASPTHLWRDMVFDRLMALDPDGNAVYYEMAESHTVSDDGTVYTFTLRDNILWHDGQPFTAEDYAWSIKTAVKAAGTHGDFVSKFATIVGMTEYMDGTADDVEGLVVDGNTVTITISSADFTFLFTIANFAPLPKHLLENEDPLTINTCAFWTGAPVGSGAYYVDEFVPNGYVLCKVFEDYYAPYGEMPKIGTVNAISITDNEAIAAMAMAGELDYVYSGDPAIAKQIESSGLFTNTVLPVNYVRSLRANLNGVDGQTDGNPKISDVRVRQALLYAVDVQKICDTVFEGDASVSYSWVNPTNQYFNGAANQFGYDVDKAKALLEEAGFDMNETIILGSHYNDQQSLNVMEAIASYWRAIGLNVEVIVMPAGTDAVTWIYDTRPFDFQYTGASAGLQLNMYTSFYSTNEYCQKLDGDYMGDSFDVAMAEFLQATTLDEQKQKAAVVQQLEEEYMPLLNMFLIPNYILENNRLTTAGIYGEQNIHYDCGFEKWTLE